MGELGGRRKFTEAKGPPIGDPNRRREPGPVESVRPKKVRSEPIGDGGRPSSDVPIVVRGRTDTKKPTIPTDTPPPVKAERNSERKEIARIREQGQHAMLISADGESAEQAMIDLDKRGRYDEKHVGGKVYLTTKHAKSNHLKNPLASEMAGDLHGAVLILKDNVGQATGFDELQFAALADDIEWMRPLRSVKRIPETLSGEEPELVFKPDLPGVIGLRQIG